jgi:hypothetical protein
LCQPKIQGGLGIQNLDIQNKCLLSKWLFKLLNEDGMWQELLRNKYIKGKTLGSCVKKTSRLSFLEKLDECKRHLYGLRFVQGERRVAKLVLGGHLVGNKPLKDKFPALFNIVRRKQYSMAQVLSSSPLNISFLPKFSGYEPKGLAQM